MTKKLSVGSWAFLFNQEKPTNDFHQVIHMLHDLGYDGVELGGFNPHPGPDTCDTREKRRKLRKDVEDHGLKFSGLAADLWSQKLWSVEDSGPYIAAFAKNLIFAEDLGIDAIRIDTVEDVSNVAKLNIHPRARSEVIFWRVARAFDQIAKLAAPRHPHLLGVRTRLSDQQAIGDRPPGRRGSRRDEQPEFRRAFRHLSRSHVCRRRAPTRLATRRPCRAEPWSWRRN